MKFLYADTTKDLIIGLLDQDLKWLHYQHVATNKTSTVIHSLIQQILQDHMLSAHQIDRFIYMAGPGSYTGMRVSDGIAQVMEWQGIKINSFYHHETPALAGIEEYNWTANAYKSEVFVFQHSHSQQQKQLMKLDQWQQYQSQAPAPILDFEQTIKMIHQNPQQILSKVINSDLKRELFYFRNIEDEFTKGKQ